MPRDTHSFFLFLKAGELCFAITLGAIYIFSFFNAKDEPTRWKYVFYYTFCLLENSALITVWFMYDSESNW